ncbi:MAG: GrpB family protein [Bacteroidota bacterium]
MLIQTYQANWPQQFQQIADVLRIALQSHYQEIEHVGSTAVPGLAAKPIIDIDIVFTTQKDFLNIKDALEQLGYYHNGDQGIPDRAVFKRVQNSKHPILDQIVHHLYACPEDSAELKRHLLFRDYLRVNPEARAAYEQLKYEIAELANQDRKQYAQIKERKARPMIESFLNLAQK